MDPRAPDHLREDEWGADSGEDELHADASEDELGADLSYGPILSMSMYDFMEDVIASTQSINTHFLEACRHNHTDIIDRFLEAKADVNARDKDGYTPLMIASYPANAGLMNKLIEAKANVNATNKKGHTVLTILVVFLTHRFSQSSLVTESDDTLSIHLATASRLIEAKAKVDFTPSPKSGKTILDLPSIPEKVRDLLLNVKKAQKRSTVTLLAGILSSQSVLARAARQPLFEPHLLRLLCKYSKS